MKRTVTLFLAVAWSLSLSTGQNTPADKRPVTKGLVLIISIDQMKSEFYDWYGRHWTGGLKRLYQEGIVYTNGSLDFASSETGPGHATLATGSFPRVHGIHANEWVDPTTRRDVYCVEDTLAGPVAGEGGRISPRNLVVTALGDWMKRSNPATKVISLSVKDRSAVLMGGQHPDHVYWYNSRTGRPSAHIFRTLTRALSFCSWVERARRRSS